MHNAVYQEKTEDDLVDRRRFGSHALGSEHPKEVRANLKAAKAKCRLLKRFPKLPDDKRLSGFDADSALWDVMEHTDRVAEGKMAPEVLLEEVSSPVCRRVSVGINTRTGPPRYCERA